jgi:hypothetical protein
MLNATAPIAGITTGIQTVIQLLLKPAFASILFALLLLMALGPLARRTGNLYVASFLVTQRWDKSRNAIHLPGVGLLRRLLARQRTLTAALLTKDMLSQKRLERRRQSTHALPDGAIHQKRTPASQTTHLFTPRRTGGVVNRPACKLEHWPAHRCCCLYRHCSPTGNHPLYRLASSWQYLGTKPEPGCGRHRAGAAAGGSSHHAKKDSFAQSHPCTLRAHILNRLEAPTHACHNSAPVP